MKTNYIRRSIPSTLTACLLCVVAMLLGACEQEQLPHDAQMRISPESRTINIADRRDAEGRCFIDQNQYLDQPVVVSMVNGDGAPLGDVEIRVYVDFSGNTYPGTLAVVKTDYYGGDRPLLLRINVSCPFKGDLFAFSAGVSASSPIELSIVGSNEAIQ